MKRLFALLTVIAASAVLFSCGGGSSDDDSAKLSGESLTITKAAGAAVDSAVNAAMDSIKTTSAKKVSALKAVSPESIEVNYSNADKSLVVSGTQAAMDVTMKDYVSESDGHKLVLNGTIKVTLTFAEGIITMLKNGTINLTYDGAAHVVIMDYTTVTNEEKGTYSITGTVTFDGTASKYEESGSKDDPNEGNGTVTTLANIMVDALTSKSLQAMNGQIVTNSTFSFSDAVIADDTRTITPKATALSVGFPDKTTATFTSSDITLVESMVLGQFPDPTVTTYTLTVKNGTVRWGGVDYTFSCTGTRTVTQSSPPTTVENYSVTINGQVIPVKFSF